jgi:hypothetical protein
MIASDLGIPQQGYLSRETDRKYLAEIPARVSAVALIYVSGR